MTRVVRGVGWLLVVAGIVVLLYVVYLLWFTNRGAEQAQRDLEQAWSELVPDDPSAGAGGSGSGGDADNGDDDGDGSVDGAGDGANPTSGPAGGPGGDGDPTAADRRPVSAGQAVAALWFERDGRRILTSVLYVVEGTDWETLKLGPGRYAGSDVPGGAGTLAIAGHRQGWGAPFYDLDKLRRGDTIHVVDRDGREWVYAFRRQEIVAPNAAWVVGEDPLGSGAPTITLTTCHPLFSNAQRLVAFGELIGDPQPSQMGDIIGQLG